MIVFDLRCAAGGHVFEGWFASSDAFLDQRRRGLIPCPMCGDTAVDKAVMAPNVGVKGNRASALAGDRRGALAADMAAPTPAASSADAPAAMRAVIAHIAAQQADMLPRSRWVGRAFAAEARALAGTDDGGAAAGPIHGQATPDEARALADEGIAIMPLLVPVVPPEMQN